MIKLRLFALFFCFLTAFSLFAQENRSPTTVANPNFKHPYSIRLSEVKFSDRSGSNLETDGFIPIKDDNGVLYRSNSSIPHYSEKGISHPIAYVSGANLYLTTTFILSCSNLAAKDKFLYIRGKAEYNQGNSTSIMNFPTQKIKIETNGNSLLPLVYKGFADKAFIKNKVIYDLAFFTSWEFSIDNMKWEDIEGDSRNELFVLWGKPIKEVLTPPNDPKEYSDRFEYQHSLFYISCFAVKNNSLIDNLASQSSNDILSAIWKSFTSQNLNGKKGLLKYYGSCITSDGKPSSSFNLIRYRSGICYAWTALLKDLLNLQGLKDNGLPYSEKHIKKIYPVDGNSCQKITYFFVKNWLPFQPQSQARVKYECRDFTRTNVYHAFYPNPNPCTGEKWSHDWLYAELNYTGGKGQGEEYPLAMFGNHGLMKIGDTYYDPSYGKTYANLTAFRDTAIVGWGIDGIIAGDEFTIGIDINKDKTVEKGGKKYNYIKIAEPQKWSLREE